MANGNGGWKLLKDSWFIVLAIVSIAASYTTLGINLNTCEKNLDIHCVEDAKDRAALIECQAEIREMRVDMNYLKASAKRSEDLANEILKELRSQ